MKEEQIIVGGQAVVEGVMMRAPHSYAVAVRRKDGTIVAKAEVLPSLADKHPILKLPVLRGAAVLVHSMILGIKALNYSTNVFFHEESEEEQSASAAASINTGIPTPIAVATKTTVKEA